MRLFLFVYLFSPYSHIIDEAGVQICRLHFIAPYYCVPDMEVLLSHRLGLVAAVLSFVGQPLVRFFDKFHIWKFRIPHALSALLSLLVILLLLLGLIAIFVPMIVNEAQTIAKIDVNQLAVSLQGPLHWVDEKLHTFGVIPAGETLQDFIVLKAKSLVDLGSVGSALGKFVSAAGSLFVGLFSILFIAFFFLKDEDLFEEGLLLFIPVRAS